MNIRHASPRDLEFLAAENRPDWLDPVADLGPRIDELQMNRVLVAEMRGEVCAVLALCFDRETRGTIERAVIDTLVVDPRFRNQGVGSRLVRFAEGIVRLRGSDRMEVDSGLEAWGGGRCWPALGYADGRVRLSKRLARSQLGVSSNSGPQYREQRCTH